MIRGRPAPLLAALALLLLGGARTAFAAAPELELVETIHVRATKALAAKRAAIEAARRNPVLEAINAYRDGTRPLEQYQLLVEIINDDKNEENREYRLPAVDALIERFDNEGVTDPAKQKIRTAVALGVLDLMKASSRDAVGLTAIQRLLDKWWLIKVRQLGFSKDDRFNDRVKAWRKMKQYLERGE